MKLCQCDVPVDLTRDTRSCGYLWQQSISREWIPSEKLKTRVCIELRWILTLNQNREPSDNPHTAAVTHISPPGSPRTSAKALEAAKGLNASSGSIAGKLVEKLLGLSRSNFDTGLISAQKKNTTNIGLHHLKSPIRRLR